MCVTDEKIKNIRVYVYMIMEYDSAMKKKGARHGGKYRFSWLDERGDALDPRSLRLALAT